MTATDVRYNQDMRRASRHTQTPAGDLRSAARSGHLVSVTSRPKGVDPVEGRVVLVGLRWAVVHRLHRDVVLDGYVAVPTLQVSQVVDLDGRDWRARELTHTSRSDDAPHVDPTTTTTLLRSAAAEFGVLEVAARRSRVLVSSTGEIERIVGRQLVFTPLRAGANVEARPLVLIPIPEIVRVEFGSSSTDALARARGHRSPAARPGVTERAVTELRGRGPDDDRRPQRPPAVA